MRRLLGFLLAGCLPAFGSGCAWLKKITDRDPKPPTPTGKLEPMPAADFVTFLNRQSGYVENVRYDSVSLKASMPDAGWIPRLSSGMLVCAKGRNLRLQAGLPAGLDGDQLDVGSNAQEMWMFVKRPTPTYLVCSHADFPRVQDDLPVPFEPDWMLQAVGLTTFPAGGDYKVEVSEKNRAYYLTYSDRAANGQPLKKVVEFSGDKATDSSPQVRKHVVLGKSADGKTWEPITIAEIKHVRTVTVGVDPETRQPAVVQVPTHILFEWPRQKVKMELTLGEVSVNGAKADAGIFARPNKIGNASPINLAEYRQQVPRGAEPRSDRKK